MLKTSLYYIYFRLWILNKGRRNAGHYRSCVALFVNAVLRVALGDMSKVLEVGRFNVISTFAYNNNSFVTIIQCVP